jgi:type I restriction-modification system DNA methylase subunit
MDCQELILQLGYKGNPAFLQGERLKEHLGYSFFFTQAQQEDRCKLRGVYVLDGPVDQSVKSSITPVVYVCEADNENEASIIHRRVWNQNIVPYLIIITPKNIRLYSGFQYDDQNKDDDRAMAVIKNAKEILDRLSAFTSSVIDSGEIWERQKISTEKRVDRRLLANLDKLSKVLADEEPKLPIEETHSLIGKYIYLKYLRDRDILSDKRLSDAGLNEGDIFGSSAKKEKLYQLEEYLNNFLNGSVFPLPSKNRIQTKHIQKVASAFKGGDPESGQQSLFDIYDFSYVPIETLSVVYQQFLHQKNKGRDKGAYYTPVCLVNFILDEMDVKRPLAKGMKILDPSCGSGAFLVQCYRRMVERIIREEKQKLNPSDLRRLLVDHIFGLDADEEACRVAELSLSLTLLDYINPPDLSKTNFKLPNLHNKNIFYCEGGFFDDYSTWANSIKENKNKTKYDWIVGNPPWKSKYDQDEISDCKALDWMELNQQQYPVGKQQLAEAFAWKTTQLLSENGQCGFLMPAMSLVKKTGYHFRASFFSQVEVWCIVNFSNLRHNLFEGADNPAAAFFFSGKKNWNKDVHYITTYAPFAVEHLSQIDQKSKKVWMVFVNYPSIKEFHVKEVMSGSSVPWKVAMWGTHRDRLLLASLANKQMLSLETAVEQKGLKLSEGLQLRFAELKDSKTEKLELCNEVQGKYRLLMNNLKGSGCIHSFSRNALEKLPKDKDIYAREGRKELSLSICYPPHVILDECRRFAVYSDEFIVVPPHQIGLSANSDQNANSGQEIFLKALALFLKSELAYYLQFWSSVKMGIERDVFNLDDLKKLDIPLNNLSQEGFIQWAKLHDEIVAAEKWEREGRQNNETPLFNSKVNTPLVSLDTLLKKMNDTVYKLLKVSKKQRWLIEDMLNVRLKLNDGKIAEEAIQPADKKEIYDFAQIFQEELDLFLDPTGKRKVHQIKVYCTNRSVVLLVEHLQHALQTQPEISEIQDKNSQRLFDGLQDKTTGKKSQWMYFIRGLRVYEGRKTYIFKPRQRLYWLKSQALTEADEFIADKVGAKEQ